MILILSDINDAHADAVQQELSFHSEGFIRFNLNKSALINTYVQYDSNGEWLIRTPDNIFSISSISSVWNRRTYVELLLEESLDDSADFKIWKNEWNKTLLGLYSSIADKPWLNFYRNSQLAENKYIQMRLAKKLGFIMPKIIVSNEKDKLIRFASEHEYVALKLMHQDFYKSNTDGFLGMYVNKLTVKDFDNFQTVGENPIALQSYIHKSYEARYTVVGNDHFVCKIDSQASSIANSDWRRYDLAHTPHSIIEPPMKIKKQVTNLMKELNLNYGALDFIIDKNENWIFLEINPMGQYLWIEHLTGLKISHAIAKWLINNSKTTKL